MAADTGLRIGITTRRGDARGYDEPRDALARDWIRFFEQALPSVPWMPIPNIGGAAAAYARSWGLNAFVFSGGDDIGDDPIRDATERTLIAHALKEGFPVLAICRGLQLLQTHFGGRLEPCEPSAHVDTRHRVNLTSQLTGTLLPDVVEVNSFHTLGIRVEALAEPLRAFATSRDGLVEGVCSPRHRLLGLMWHPEREPYPLDHDVRLIRSFFHPNLSNAAYYLGSNAA